MLKNVSGFGVLLASSMASAQVAPPAGYVPIEVTGDPELTHVLVPEGRPDLAMRCKDTKCRFLVPRGRYRIVSEAQGEEIATRFLDVLGPTTVQVKQGSGARRGLGLTLGVVGPVVILGSLIAMASVINRYDDDPTPGASRARDRALVGPYVGMGVGAAITAGGWVLFGTAGSSMRVEPTTSVIGIAMVPLPGGVGCGFGGAF